MDEDTVYHLIKTPFSSYTENTLTDFTRLEKELANVRLEGVALDNGEMDIDVRCIADADYGLQPERLPQSAFPDLVLA